MPIDPKHVGRTFGPHAAVVEAGRLRFFAKATAQKSRVFFDDPAAKACGYERAIAPPTFAFCLRMDREHPFEVLEALEVPLPRVLHGEQSFIYHGLLQSGDEVAITDRIAEIVSKRGGALEILRIASEVRQPDGALVVEMVQTLVIRNP